MKLSMKPIQSPSRTDKYPPTPLLMRRLRLQGGSRRVPARSRRTFSLFRRRASNYEATATQEPSSPKVTCIGQVRVRKKKPPSSASSTAATTITSRRKCSVFCRCFPGKPLGKSKSSANGTVWRRLMTAIHDPLNKHAGEEEDDDDDGDEDRVKEKVATLLPREYDELRAKEATDEATEGGEAKERTAAEPPKNALLLMRCRSAPVRDSSPMSRFWESPIVNSSDEPGMQNVKEVPDGGKEGNEDDQASAPPPPPPPSPPQSAPAADLGRASTDSVVSEGRRIRKDEESAWAPEAITTPTGIGKGRESSPVLTRCKSEPRPQPAAGIFPEAYFWKRRVGFS
ncbi:unnamed protein product [Victoria cruziana]